MSRIAHDAVRGPAHGELVPPPDDRADPTQISLPPGKVAPGAPDSPESAVHEPSARGRRLGSREKTPRRGEVWWVHFPDSRGGEIRKIRPAVIVSNDVANRKLNRVVVVPITSATSRIYPSEAEVLLAGLPGKATADQIRTASKSRLMRVIGSLSTAEITALDLAIRIHLGLD